MITLKRVCLILFILLCFFIHSLRNKTNESLLIQDEEIVVSLFTVGDNLIHHTIYEAAYVNQEYNFLPFYEDIKPLINQYDLKFINQETILGGKEIGLSTYPAFNSPYELGDALVEVGFNLISIANNHTLDRGEKAIINAINYLDQKPVIYSGAVKNENISQVKMFNQKGIKFAFVAYTYGTNGISHPQGKEYLANVYSNEKARQDILKVRYLVDVIIVSMHWGDEYQDYPNEVQIKQANYLADLGVDIIIGHHPHVIQPVDVIVNDERETFVIYSLGNFLSDQKGIDRLIGMGVGVDICKKANGKIELKNKTATLLYRYKDGSNTFRIIPFNNLDNDYLNDYEYYFEKKKRLIQTYFKDIIVN